MGQCYQKCWRAAMKLEVHYHQRQQSLSQEQSHKTKTTCHLSLLLVRDPASTECSEHVCTYTRTPYYIHCTLIKLHTKTHAAARETSTSTVFTHRSECTQVYIRPLKKKKKKKTFWSTSDKQNSTIARQVIQITPILPLFFLAYM